MLKFSEDGSFLIGRGVTEQPTARRRAASSGWTSIAVYWTIGADEDGFDNCDSFAFSEPQQRLSCGDYFGSIRGRSLATGALDGTIVAH